jgi:hypothetical protein
MDFWNSELISLRFFLMVVAVTLLAKVLANKAAAKLDSVTASDGEQ